MARKNAWFKHYNTALQGDTLQQFIANRDYECVVLFWALLEILSRTELEEKRGETQIEITFLSRAINMKPTKLIRLLSRFGQIALDWNLTVTEAQIKIRVPNWLKLQESRGGKRQSKNLQSTGEVRGEKAEVRGQIEENNLPTDFLFSEGKYFKRLSQTTRDILISAYPGDFLEREMMETESFIEANELKYINNLEKFIPRNLQDKWQHQALRRKQIEQQLNTPGAIKMVADL